MFLANKRDRDDGDQDQKNSKQIRVTRNTLPLGLNEAKPSTTIEQLTNCHENDIGRFVGKAESLTPEKRKDLLTKPWIPNANYKFENDATNLKRKFNYHWLKQYSPWLVYSSYLKGALCLTCVMFPPAPGTVKGVLGSFIIAAYTKFKNMHEDCRKHSESHYHKGSTLKAKTLLENVPVDIKITKWTSKDD